MSSEKSNHRITRSETKKARETNEKKVDNKTEQIAIQEEENSDDSQEERCDKCMVKWGKHCNYAYLPKKTASFAFKLPEMQPSLLVHTRRW